MKRIPGMLLLAAIFSTTLASASWSHRVPYENEWSIGIGAFEPRGSSDLWEQNEQNFTFAPDDFDGLVGAASLGTLINNFVAFDFGISYYQGDTRSADRVYVDIYGNAINHESRLQLSPVTAELRIMPFGFYRGGKPANGPQHVVPYFGFGGGALLWRYEEEGEFVDTLTLTTFQGDFSSRGVAPEYHGFVGVDLLLSHQVSVFLEGRVSRAKDNLDSDYQGFDELDLSGTSLMIGTRIRF